MDKLKEALFLISAIYVCYGAANDFTSMRQNAVLMQVLSMILMLI